MFPSYYARKSQGIAFVYDITSRDSFRRMIDLLKDFDSYTRTKAVKVLIGNKSDLETKREVSI